MTLTQIFNQLTNQQKIRIYAVALILSLFIICLIFDSAVSSFRAKVAERKAETAKRESDALIEKAAKIASEIRAKELELNSKEAKRDVVKTELDTKKRETADARRDYQRTIDEPLPATPSTDELCSDLARLGYPCR